jgi:membrane protein YdbS with pleckstrin-like domain
MQVAAESGHEPGVADGAEHQLDPRAIAVDRLVWCITAAVVCLALAIVLLILAATVSLPGWALVAVMTGWCGVALLFVWASYRWPVLEYRYASFKVDEQGIELRRGVVWREVISVPRSRVQHIDVSQGPLERAYGLGTMHLYTAGTEYANVAVWGLDYPLALRIRDHLLPRGGGDAV